MSHTEAHKQMAKAVAYYHRHGWPNAEVRTASTRVLQDLWARTQRNQLLPHVFEQGLADSYQQLESAWRALNAKR